VRGTGWYAGGTWTVFGALRNSGAPRKGLDRGGIGAIQLAARVEALGFASDMSGLASEDPLRNPRAVNIMGNDVRAETLGVNWTPIRFVRLQFNLIREHLEDPERRPDPERSYLYTRIFRMQFAW
jgi:phosphate-selective porin